MEVKTNSKIFFIILFILIIISISATYFKYVVVEDYQIFNSEDELPSQLFN